MGADAGLARGVIEAGGSLPRDEALVIPGPGRQLRLLLELTLVFVCAPVAITLAVYGFRIPLFVMLPPVLCGVLLYLLWDKTFHVRGELYRGFARSELMSILGIFVVVACLVAAFVATQMPHVFLNLPRYAPKLWLFVLFAYPIASVMAQELIYRTFFFHRYGPLFGDQRWMAILVNGSLFGFGHVMFYSTVSIILSALVGCLLAWRYDRTRSFWAVWLEHSLYGGLVFTVGLGRYFFTGVASLG